ncbi:putative ribosomal protein S18 [Lyophyllum shimeji]|uniref:Small ribosomal subunit protein bS18m n=1 Tax=Lyophyllum shimeji TaxID=47721 RepID=A0A9P3UK10_LYOSH|nr:putative ribosomal protein S18 [Lyophyllum shimeji]
MLSLFCHVGRRSTAAIRPSLAANYSVDAAPPTGAAWNDLGRVLKDQGERQDARASHKPFAGSTTSQQRPQPVVTKWKAFQPTRFVRPHELTYKARVNAPPSYIPRRPAVGPPPAVARYNDVFHQFNIDPLSQAMNPDILSHYVSEMGKIYSRNITGLTTKSQRKIGKAIRRAKMMGIIPVLSKTRGLYSQYRSKNRRT